MHTLSKLGMLLLGGLTVAAGSSCDSPMFNRNDPARIHRNEGIVAFKDARWGDAADHWKKSLEAKPNQPELYERLAYAEVKAGRLDDAAVTLEKTKAFQSTPKQKLDVTRKIATMYLQNGRPDKAEQRFLDVLKEEPDDDATITWLGEIHSLLGGARSGAAPADLTHLDQAIAYYDRAIAINPENLTPYVNKRIALFKTQHHWNGKKINAEKEEAALPKREKAQKAEAKARAVEAQAKLDELTPRVEVVSAKITELLKKRAAAADGGTADGDGGTADGDGGTAGGVAGGEVGTDGGAPAP